MVGTNTCYYSPQDLQDIKDHILYSSLSKSTIKTYRRMLNQFTNFQKTQYASDKVFPSTTGKVADYIAFLFMKNQSFATILSHVSVISFVHRLDNLKDPTKHFLLSKMLKGIQKLKPTHDIRLPITPTILLKIITALPHVIPKYFNRVLFQSMFVLAFHAFLRIGEFTVTQNNTKDTIIQVNNVEFLTNGNITVWLYHYKNSDGKSAKINLQRSQTSALCPTRTLQTYLNISKHRCGSLFQLSSGSPVSYTYFTKTLKSLIEFIGLDPKFYKGHSFRIGAATHAASTGVPESVIQHLGRWKSNAVQKYIRMNQF